MCWRYYAVFFIFFFFFFFSAERENKIKRKYNIANNFWVIVPKTKITIDIEQSATIPKVNVIRFLILLHTFLWIFFLLFFSLSVDVAEKVKTKKKENSFSDTNTCLVGCARNPRENKRINRKRKWKKKLKQHKIVCKRKYTKIVHFLFFFFLGKAFYGYVIFLSKYSLRKHLHIEKVIVCAFLFAIQIICCICECFLSFSLTNVYSDCFFVYAYRICAGDFLILSESKLFFVVCYWTDTFEDYFQLYYVYSILYLRLVSNISTSTLHFVRLFIL